RRQGNRDDGERRRIVVPGVEGRPVAAEDPDLDHVRALGRGAWPAPAEGAGLAAPAALPGEYLLGDLGVARVVDLQVDHEVRVARRLRDLGRDRRALTRGGRGGA